ncbi:tetracycline resistance protein from transposon [Xylariales sp. AK1849]|nr:tetracycline resistance protein from transposon [Xylariales sp. AK1849]
MTTPKIAIIGAGPVGCMIARILSLSNISTTIFESDSSPDYRSQGGTLDLHPDTGLAALKDAQLYDDFKKIARYTGDYYLMTDKNCKPFVEWGPSKSGASERPEIDRADLRKLIAESLPEGTINWGNRLQRVGEGGKLVFEHGVESGFDLIVGCEGGWSKVRKYLTEVRPRYTGIGYTVVEIAAPEQAAPNLYKLVNGGNVFSHAEGKKIAIQQMGDGSLHVGWASIRPEHWMETCGYNPRDLESTRQAILEEMSDWSPRLREAVEKADGKCEPRNLYMLPVGWTWEHRRGATIIGDAAHVMTPFAGEGLNVGLDDARRLAAVIIKAVQSGRGLDGIDEAISVSEKEMCTRMKKYQRLTDELTQLWFSSPDTAWYFEERLHDGNGVNEKPSQDPVCELVFSSMFDKRLQSRQAFSTHFSHPAYNPVTGNYAG